MKKLLIVLVLIFLFSLALAFSLTLSEKPLPKEEEEYLKEVFEKPDAEIKKFDSTVLIGKTELQTESFSVDGTMFNRIDAEALASVKTVKEEEK